MKFGTLMFFADIFIEGKTIKKNILKNNENIGKILTDIEINDLIDNSQYKTLVVYTDDLIDIYFKDNEIINKIKGLAKTIESKNGISLNIKYHEK